MFTDKIIINYSKILALTLSLTSQVYGKPIEKQEVKMNEDIELYTWVRSNESILIAKIIEAQIDRSTIPGQERVKLRFQIEETLWGTTGSPFRQCEFLRPASEIGRQKSRDPIWGRINVKKGPVVLFVSSVSSENVSEPVYVEEIHNTEDPVIVSLRSVLKTEKISVSKDERVKRYLSWIADGQHVVKIFAGQALTHDADMSGSLQQSDVMNSLTRAFASSSDLNFRYNLGTWLWDDVYPKINSIGRVCIINALINGLSDSSEDIIHFSQDSLIRASPSDFRQVGISKSPELLRFLQTSLAEEPSPEAKKHIQKLIEALSSK